MQALDIIKSLSDQKGGNDMAEAAALLGEHFRHKYFLPIKKNFDEKCSYCSQNPSPQVNLIRALMPFVKNGEGLEKAAEMMTKYDAAQKIVKECYNKAVDDNKNAMSQKNEKKFFSEENRISEQNMSVITVLLLMMSNRI